MYKVIFPTTDHHEFLTYAEAIDVFGREEFKNILKGLNNQVAAHPAERDELKAVA